jgi:hypothetical protein
MHGSSGPSTMELNVVEGSAPRDLRSLAFALRVAAAGSAEGDRDGGNYGDQDNEQRGEDGDMHAEALRYELRPDEDQDHCQPVVQVDEAIDQPFQREVEGS